MTLRRLLVSAVLLVLTRSVCPAQVPQLISYQGRVTVGGTNFTGTGQFQFAFVSGDATATFWSNGTDAVALAVNKGLYSVLLGDTNVANMAAIPATVFTNADVRLRVWFDAGAGLDLLSPDQRLGAVGYALMAASVADGAITSNKLAAGAVTAPAIADGAINGNNLAPNIVLPGSLVVGNTTNPIPPAGTIRWTGVDFQGFNGYRWVSLTQSGFVVTPSPVSNMVAVAAGTFVMGSPDSDPDRIGDEFPQTQVTITYPFWIGKYLVTVSDYQSAMGLNPSTYGYGPTYPVETVSWNDATNYCATLTQRERQAGHIGTDYVYRLPTEAEWEYCCRAGSTTRYYYGDDLDYSLLSNFAWYSGDLAGGYTHPVRMKTPNAWDLFDMHGNVWEWCSDWYGGYLGGSVTNYTGPATGTTRIYRGGSWVYNAPTCRSARRNNNDPTYSSGDLGLRIVLAPTQP